MSILPEIKSSAEEYGRLKSGTFLAGVPITSVHIYTKIYKNIQTYLHIIDINFLLITKLVFRRPTGCASGPHVFQQGRGQEYVR